MAGGYPPLSDAEIRHLAERFLLGLYALVCGRAGRLVQATEVWNAIHGPHDGTLRQMTERLLTDLGFIKPERGGITLLAVGKDYVEALF